MSLLATNCQNLSRKPCDDSVLLAEEGVARMEPWVARINVGEARMEPWGARMDAEARAKAKKNYQLPSLNRRVLVSFRMIYILLSRRMIFFVKSSKYV